MLPEELLQWFFMQKNVENRILYSVCSDFEKNKVNNKTDMKLRRTIDEGEKNRILKSTLRHLDDEIKLHEKYMIMQ